MDPHYEASGVFFGSQVISNACATPAIVSVLMNRPELELGPELSQLRDMTYNETQALAKELEEAQLVRDMETDIARQVVRQLSTLSRPGNP